MSTEAIEQKLTELSARVEALEGKKTEKKKGGWQAIVGFAKDDDLLDEALRLGAEIRAKANAEGR